MAGFRHAVLSTCWLIPSLGTFYFWVVALSTFSPAPSSEHSTSPTSAKTKCDPEVIKNTMSIWMRWMALFFVASISFLSYVRKVVEAAADAETKGDSFQDEAYKHARDELNQAMKVVDKATPLAAVAEPTTENLADYVKAVGQRNVLIAKVARTKPKSGLARLPRGMQMRMRLLFFLVIVLSIAAGVCSSVSFYLSLRLQIGLSRHLQIRCDDGVAEIAPFVLIGLIFVSMHLEAAWASFFED